MTAGTTIEKNVHREWLERVDNLFTALQIYRDVENQASSRIKTILAEKGITISTEEIRISDSERIREKLRQTRDARLHEEQLQQEQGRENDRGEEYVCRR